MNQLLCIHIGQAGVQLASSCWELFCLEHDIQPDGTLKPEKTTTDDLDVLFNETTGGKYTARSLLIDLDPSTVNKVASGAYKQVFQPSNRVTWKEDAANNAIRGHYTVGKEILDESLEKIGRIVDECLFFKGFLVFNSIGGGTGGGFASLLLERLGIDFPSKEIINFNVYPSQRYSTSPVEPYNAILNISETLNVSKTTNFVFDNERLYQICSKGLGIEKPTYTDINRLIAQVASSVTSPLRFEGPLNYKLNELTRSLKPHPMLNCVVSSYCPLSIPPKTDPESDIDPSPSVAEITKAAFNPNNYMADCDPSKGKYLGVAATYRGDPALKDVQESLKLTIAENKLKFYAKSDGVKIGVTSQPAWSIKGDNKQKLSRSLCVTSNTSAVKTVFKKIAKNYGTLYARRAFVHWYVGEGLSEGFFSEAEWNLTQIIKDYEEIENDNEREEEIEKDERGNEREEEIEKGVKGKEGEEDDEGLGIQSDKEQLGLNQVDDNI